MHEDAKLLGTHSEDVEVELANGRVGPKDVVATEGTAGDHHGVAGEHEAGSVMHGGYARSTPGLPRVISSLCRFPSGGYPQKRRRTSAADVNQGAVVTVGCWRWVVVNQGGC